jgi:hypothetical protein
MGKYDAHLSNLTQAEIIARLEGPGGLLAVSAKELFYLDDHTRQSAHLSQIKRIAVNKQTGKVDVVGEQGLMMEIAPAAFQKDELKLFLESLKGYVLKAKSEASERSGAVEQPPASPPFPKPEENAPTPGTPVSLPPKTTPGEPSPKAVVSSPVAASGPINITEPPKTLPDEPSDSIWAYDGSPRPGAASATGGPAPIPAGLSSEGDAAMPPVAAASTRALSPTQRVVSLLLKVSALITAAVTAGFLTVNMGVIDDIWIPLGVVAVGLSLSLIQWRLSEPY